MRKIFTCLLILAGCVVANASQSTWVIDPIIRPASLRHHATASRGGDASVEFTLTPSNESRFLIVGALRTIDGQNDEYWADVSDDSLQGSISLPSGTYDIYAFGFYGGNDSDHMLLLLKENVQVSGNVEVAFRADEGTNLVTPSFLSPEGEEFKLSDSDQNYLQATSEAMFSYNGHVLFGGPFTTGLGKVRDIRTNFTNNKISYTCIQGIYTQDCQFVYVLPFDFSKSVANTTTEGWTTSYTPRFATTPINVLHDAYEKEKGDYYSIASMGIMVDNDLYYSIVNGIHSSEGTPGNTIRMWAPKGYDGMINAVVFPLGSVMNGDDSSIQSFPIINGSDGLERIAANWAFESGGIGTRDGRMCNVSNPLFDRMPANPLYGNCAPCLVTATEADGIEFQFNFTGRYGEVLSIDSWNIYSQVVEDFANDYYKGGTNKVKVYLDGELLSEKRAEIPQELYWGEYGEYTIEIECDNILVDGKIPGKVTGSTTYNPRETMCAVPTMTYLGFENSDGVLTDRLVTPDNALIYLYASVMAPDLYSEHIPCYLYTAPSAVTVEYAPYGSTDFKPLEIASDPANDFIPGWGFFYKGNLSAMTGESTNGWWDLRIVVEDSNGGRQEQVISPALYIGEDAGLDMSGRLPENDGDVEYYNLQGVKISTPASGQIVIVRKGNSAYKTVLR